MTNALDISFSNLTPSPSALKQPNPNSKKMEMSLGDVDPYLNFDYAALVMNSIIPMHAKVVGGVFIKALLIIKMDGCVEPFQP